MIISKTPLRISFAGGGSDLQDYYQHKPGAVVSTAINRYIYIAVNRKFDDTIRVGYSKVEVVDGVDNIEHNIAREALKMSGLEKGLDVVYMSDMKPAQEGTGLGSSSSIAVGTLNALYAFSGERASAEKLAKEASKIEIELIKSPIGKQDQYAVAYGNFNYIQFNPDGSVFVEPIVCREETKKELDKRLIMFFTGIKADSSVVLGEQKKNTGQNIEVLDRMVDLAKKLKSDLERNDISEFGNILHENWLLKQKLSSGITNPKIEELYQKARQAGAVGGKILGSGGGGFLLLYCQEENQQKVREALADLKELPFSFEPQGSRIVYVG